MHRFWTLAALAAAVTQATCQTGRAQGPFSGPAPVGTQAPMGSPVPMGNPIVGNGAPVTTDYPQGGVPVTPGTGPVSYSGDWSAVGGPVGLGTRGRFQLPKTPFKGFLDVEIVGLEPDRRVVFRVTHPSLTWISSAETRPDGDGTQFVYGGEMTLHGWRRLLEPMLKSELAAGEAKEAEQLKALLESEARVALPT